MGRYAKESGSGSSFTPAPAGTHVARAFALIDLGTQHGEYAGEPTVRNQVVVQFELPNELMQDGQPFSCSKFYTNSLHEKAALRHDLEAWRGRAFNTEELMQFDLMNVLGKPCMITVQHTVNNAGNTKAKITAVTALPKGMACPPQINASRAFWIDEWDTEAFLALPEGFRKLIEQSDEYKRRDKQPVAAGDDVPFDPRDPNDPPF